MRVTDLKCTVLGQYPLVRICTDAGIEGYAQAEAKTYLEPHVLFCRDMVIGAAGVPVHKLLGGKVRDRVRVYNGAVRFPLAGSTPQDYADNMARMKAAPEWWYDIVEGLPDPIVQDGYVTVWDRPGMGVDLIPEAARQYLGAEDTGFFD